ncbi:Aste57867_22138 [Aphanomyces stellatus]|uniref:Aste57867_22138 protein n=1 Tax=Aphanomyces stellatus TaxID=120398 RepID=A0A485LKQ9_9STRA|nr:hypothetical protein As57867_022069 [Aphanomyces stellatus]VFT98806.1 Aste57867_22138 [Aphanomyces stellatus]
MTERLESHFVTISTPKVAGEATVGHNHLRKVPKLAIEWQIDELSAQITKGRGVTETKVILKNVNGLASAGQLVVIMGPSGAGKSSMLDIIAGRNKDFKGHVKVNGLPWSKELNKRACYVMQDDVFYHTLTVEEHLQFQAMFRMGNSCTPAQRNERVQFVIDELGLRKCKDTRIGNAQAQPHDHVRMSHLCCTNMAFFVNFSGRLWCSHVASVMFPVRAACVVAPVEQPSVRCTCSHWTTCMCPFLAVVHGFKRAATGQRADAPRRSMVHCTHSGAFASMGMQPLDNVQMALLGRQIHRHGRTTFHSVVVQVLDHRQMAIARCPVHC